MGSIMGNNTQRLRTSQGNLASAVGHMTEIEAGFRTPPPSAAAVASAEPCPKHRRRRHTSRSLRCAEQTTACHTRGGRELHAIRCLDCTQVFAPRFPGFGRYAGDYTFPSAPGASSNAPSALGASPATLHAQVLSDSSPPLLERAAAPDSRTCGSFHHRRRCQSHQGWRR